MRKHRNDIKEGSNKSSKVFEDPDLQGLAHVVDSRPETLLSLLVLSGTQN